MFRYGVLQGTGLNRDYYSDCVAAPAGRTAQSIRHLVLKLFNQFLSEDGKYVDYKVIN